MLGADRERTRLVPAMWGSNWGPDYAHYWLSPFSSHPVEPMAQTPPRELVKPIWRALASREQYARYRKKAPRPRPRAQPPRTHPPGPSLESPACGALRSQHSARPGRGMHARGAHGGEPRRRPVPDVQRVFAAPARPARRVWPLPALDVLLALQATGLPRRRARPTRTGLCRRALPKHRTTRSCGRGPWLARPSSNGRPGSQSAPLPVPLLVIMNSA